jgi:predicted  nucleic acid-binding Zn-ribbon protein
MTQPGDSTTPDPQLTISSNGADHANAQSLDQLPEWWGRLQAELAPIRDAIARLESSPDLDGVSDRDGGVQWLGRIGALEARLAAQRYEYERSFERVEAELAELRLAASRMEEREQQLSESLEASAQSAAAFRRFNQEQIVVLNQFLRRVSDLRQGLAGQQAEIRRLLIAAWITGIAIIVLLIAHLHG